MSFSLHNPSCIGGTSHRKRLNIESLLTSRHSKLLTNKAQCFTRLGKLLNNFSYDTLPAYIISMVISIYKSIDIPMAHAASSEHELSYIC